VRVVVARQEFVGRAIDLRPRPTPIDGETAVAAVRRGGAEAGSDTDTGTDMAAGDPRVRVRCRPPGPVHEFVGHLAAETTVPLRRALAAAARSRGLSAPQDDALRDVRAELADCEVPSIERREARRRAAAAGDEVERLRERVATLRGRVETLRDLGREAEADEVAADLATAATRLSEVETERDAAAQLLAELEEREREARDVRERRLRLEDRAANLERAARRSLAASVYDRFQDAVRRLPGDAAPGDEPGAFSGDPVTAALAVAAVADVTAPVVLATRRFADASTAAARLDAPIIRV